MAPAERLPNARELGETSLAFLVDPALDIAAMENTARVLREVCASASIDTDA
jgi:dTDP-4-amino-4,6-dideoxygalactose transaminase